MTNGEEVITTRQNRTVVEVAKLADRREREATGRFRFDGVKLLLEAIANGVEMPVVLLRQSNAGRIAERVSATAGRALCDCCGRLLTLSDGVFDKISEEKSPEGVICVAKDIDKSQKIVTIYNDGKIPGRDETVVLLESVRDPSNIGAIIRSAG